MPFSLSITPKPLAQSTALILPAGEFNLVASEAASLVHLADYWQPTEPGLTMAEVRLLQQFATYSAVGEYKVAVICQADQLKGEVINALLKLIEEPPAYLYLLLLAETDHFLPTLRSRLQVQYSTQETGDASQSLKAWQSVLGEYDTTTTSGRRTIQRLLFWYPMVHQTIKVESVLEPFKHIHRS